MGGGASGRAWALVPISLALSAIFSPMFTVADVNLYMPIDETQRLLGLMAELYYVREGVVNTYALEFTVPVPANLTYMYFTWQNFGKKPLHYIANVDYNNGDAMALPRLNISQKGFVPNKPSTFRVSLPCSGRSNAEVFVSLHLNLTSHNHRYDLSNITIKRNKICLKEERMPRNESIYLQPEWVPSSLGNLYVAMGSAGTFSVLLLTVAAVLYLRVKRARQRSPNCRYYNGPGYLRDLKGAPSLHSNSYATIASFKKIPIMGPEFTSTKYGTNQSEKDNGTPLHYASSSVSRVYSQPYSPIHSIPPSRHSHVSCCASSLHSQLSWRDPRQIDPSERMRQLSIDRWKVEMGELVQEGTFGRVHRGLYRDPYARTALGIIIKTVSAEASSSQAWLAVREGLLLAGLHHQNLLPVLGVCFEDPRHPLLLYPHLGLTNLKVFLLNSSKGAIDGVKLLTRDLVHSSVQVCLGLLFLHQQRILHKDVATRNCLIDSELQVRVSDTALARDLFPLDYHCLGDNENRPIKWLAMESLINKQFSAASEAWMFGVLLWELTTLSQQPYMEVDPFEMATYLRNGYRLVQPANCPDELYGMMACCWAPFPEDRPSFARLLILLQDFHTALGKYI